MLTIHWPGGFAVLGVKAIFSQLAYFPFWESAESIAGKSSLNYAEWNTLDEIYSNGPGRLFGRNEPICRSHGLPPQREHRHTRKPCPASPQKWGFVSHGESHRDKRTILQPNSTQRVNSLRPEVCSCATHSSGVRLNLSEVLC